MSLRNSLGVALTAGALAITPTACNDYHPELCSTKAKDQDGKDLPVITNQKGEAVSVPCQCETEDKPEKAVYYSVDDPNMPYQCQAEVSEMIDKELNNNTGGSGGSAGSPGVGGSGNYPGTGGSPSCSPTTEVCDGYDNDCDGQKDEDGVCNNPVLCQGTLNLHPSSLRVFVAKCAGAQPYVSEIANGDAQVNLNDNGPCVTAGVFDNGVNMDWTGNQVLMIPAYNQGPGNPIDTSTYPGWADYLMSMADQGQVYLEFGTNSYQQSAPNESLYVGTYCDPYLQQSYSAGLEKNRPMNTSELLADSLITDQLSKIQGDAVVLTVEGGKIKVQREANLDQ